MKDDFNDADLAELPSGGARWHKHANFMRLLLTGERILDDNSRRGTWEFTNKGWQEYRGLQKL